MKRQLASAALVLAMVLGLGTLPAGAGGRPEATPSAPQHTGHGPGYAYTYARPSARPTGDQHARASATTSTAPSTTSTSAATTFTAPPNDDFVFDFDPSVDAAKRAVFAAAAGIWSSVLEVEVPIHVDVTATHFGDPGILGGATPTDIYANDLSFPRQNVWYVPAEANQFASRDLDPSTAEIDVQISSDYDFYEGADGAVPPNQISLLTLALHELAHGLGHTTLASVAGSTATMATQGFPLAYDSLLLNSSQTPLVSLTPTQLATALTTRVLWGGREGIAADGGFYPEIYAPGTYVAGTSTSHLDERTYQDALMTPFIDNGESQLSVPALTQAMFADFGWGLEVTDQIESFITAVHRDFLRFFPTPTETTTDLGQLQSGQLSRRSYVARYGDSDIYVGQVIDSYYLATLGRAADPTGKQTWLDAIDAGMTPAEVAARIYASSEYFKNAGSTNRAWIADLYRQILEREPDSGGLDAWTGLADGGTPRATIALRFYQSYESRRTRVTNLYLHLLKRPPDSGGLVTWTNELTNGRDVALAIDLASSAEYYQKAYARYGG